MSHEVETMCYAGEIPWHGLGKSVSNDLTPQQMLVEAGLDWTVDKIPAYTKINGKEVALDTCALVRSTDNKILSEISSDWNPVQNQEAFEFFTDFVAAGDMEMHTAGSLQGGRKVWALAKVKESFTVFGGDTVDSFLLFSNPHEYGKSTDIRFTPIRAVCKNTVALALKTDSKNKTKVSHRTKFNADEVKQTLKIAHYKLEQYKDMALTLGKTRYTNENIVEYFQRVFPIIGKNIKKEELSRTAKKALETVQTQPGAKYAEGSMWQLFNCATYLVDHDIGHNADNRMTSAWYGAGARTKTEALELALEYCK